LIRIFVEQDFDVSEVEMIFQQSRPVVGVVDATSKVVDLAERVIVDADT
jgi:hypothetical protein